MSMVSDPRIETSERPIRPLLGANEGSLPAFVDKSAPPERSRRPRAMVLYGLLSIVTAVVAVRMLASALAIPLETPATGAAPRWMVRVTTTGAKHGTALVYGEEVGFQLLQIPAGGGGTSDARIVPARLAKGELHLISLSFTSLRVSASGPPGSGVNALSAQSPIITAFQSPDGTGVRTGW